MASKKCKWLKGPAAPGGYYSPDARVLIYKCKDARGSGDPAPMTKAVSRSGKTRWIRKWCARHMPSGLEERFIKLNEAKMWACKRK